MNTLSTDLYDSRTDRVALPFCSLTLTAQKPPEKAYPTDLLTIGDHLRKRRLELKLLQKDVGRMLRVDTTTINNWEKNRCKPKLYLVPKIIQFLGYHPKIAESRTLGERIVECRRLQGWSQKELARRLGVDSSTLARWEKDRSEPSTSSKAILGEILNCRAFD